MKYHIHHLSCFDAQVVGLDDSGKNAVKQALAKMRDGETARDTIDDKETIKQILSGTGIPRDRIGPGILEFNLTGHWRVFCYKTGPWTRTTVVKDKFKKVVPASAALSTIYDGTYWLLKIGHLESKRCMTPSSKAL